MVAPVEIQQIVTKSRGVNPCPNCGKHIPSNVPEYGRYRKGKACYDCEPPNPMPRPCHQCGKEMGSSSAMYSRWKSGVCLCEECKPRSAPRRSLGVMLCEECGEKIPKGRRVAGIMFCYACRPKNPGNHRYSSPEEAHEVMKACWRNKNHTRRRAMEKVTDTTAKWELGFRSKAKRCAICNELLGAARHIDHIIPINVGGTHMRANLRMTCPTCNGQRPHDGRDVDGHQMDLWMGTDAVADILGRRQKKPVVCVRCGSEDIPDHRRGRGDKQVCYGCVPRAAAFPKICIGCGDDAVPPERMHTSRLCLSCKPKYSHATASSLEDPISQYRGRFDIREVARLESLGMGDLRIAKQMSISTVVVKGLRKTLRRLGIANQTRVAA